MLYLFYKRLRRMFQGEYPIDFILYKLMCRNGRIKKSFLFYVYKLFEKKNSQLGNAQELLFETYDGLNQATHPTACEYNGKYYFACTPFPFGNDYYENPCLYTSENGICYEPVEGMSPVIRPRKHDNLIYLSDPYLYTEDNNMYLLYRECAYNNSSEYIATVYEKRMDKNKKWHEEKVLISNNRGLMSPCVVFNKEKKYLYYVVFDDKKTNLVRVEYGTDDEEKLNVRGIPEGMMIWHIDFFSAHNGTNIGLFTLSVDHYGGGARLFVATSENCRDWLIRKEIIFDKNLVKKMYKSCMIHKDKKDILYVSLRRKDRKWKIYYLDNFIYSEYI